MVARLIRTTHDVGLVDKGYSDPENNYSMAHTPQACPGPPNIPKMEITQGQFREEKGSSLFSALIFVQCFVDLDCSLCPPG